jgi:hypothetical protein
MTDLQGTPVTRFPTPRDISGLILEIKPKPENA